MFSRTTAHGADQSEYQRFLSADEADMMQQLHYFTVAQLKNELTEELVRYILTECPQLVYFETGRLILDRCYDAAARRRDVGLVTVHSMLHQGLNKGDKAVYLDLKKLPYVLDVLKELMPDIHSLVVTPKATIDACSVFSGFEQLKNLSFLGSIVPVELKAVMCRYFHLEEFEVRVSTKHQKLYAQLINGKDFRERVTAVLWNEKQVAGTGQPIRTLQLTVLRSKEDLTAFWEMALYLDSLPEVMLYSGSKTDGQTPLIGVLVPVFRNITKISLSNDWGNVAPLIAIATHCPALTFFQYSEIEELETEAGVGLAEIMRKCRNLTSLSITGTDKMSAYFFKLLATEGKALRSLRVSKAAELTYELVEYMLQR